MDEKLHCHICRKEDNEGIILLNKYICRTCELEMASLSFDELRYEGMKRNIKDIWKGVVLNMNKGPVYVEF